MGKRRRKPKLHRNIKLPAKEVWKSIWGYEPAYNLKVSSYGRVILQPEIITDTNGRSYALIAGRQIPVDRLVCDAFIPNRTFSEQPWHINGDMSDNRAENLRWVDYTSDPEAPGRMYSTLSLLQYILHPSLLAERDKEFNKFYTYLEYLWKTGRMPEEQEQLIMDGYDMHRKRVTEDWMQREQLKKDVADMLDSQYRASMTDISEKKRSKKNTHPVTEPDSDGNTDSAPKTPKSPFEIPDDDVMASALTRLYDKITDAAVRQPSRFRSVGWSNLEPIPYLITPAMARVANVGECPNKLLVYNMRGGNLQMTAKDTKTVYKTPINTASLLEQSLTAPYHLNMVPQCPKIKSEKVAKPTQHLQSLICTLKKTGEFPDWAKDSLIETLLNIIKEEKQSHNKYCFGVTVKSENQQTREKNKLSNLEAVLTDGLEKMMEDEMKIKGSSVPANSSSPASHMRNMNKSVKGKPLSDDKPTGSNNNTEDNTDLPTTSSKVRSSDTSPSLYDDYGFIAESPKASSKRPSATASWDDGYVEPVITKITRLDNPTDAIPLISADDSDNTAIYTEPLTEADIISSGLDISDTTSDSTASTISTKQPEIKPGTDAHKLLNPDKYTPEGIYIGNNRNPDSKYNRDVHPNRVHIVSDDVIRMFKVSVMINSEPEFDEKGRPLRDKHYRKISYNDSEIPLGAPGVSYMGMGFHSAGDSQNMVDGFVKQMEIIRNGYDPENISPLYDPAKDITLGMVNSNAGLEESSYYNQLGQKVYHNVRYGERYDPERHTLYIPEIEAFPNPFSVEVRKRNYLDDYVKYLKKHYPEIEDPEIMRKYYATALAVKRIQKNVLPNCPKNEIFRKDRKEIPVRCWLPNGECMVFDQMKQASEATGVGVDMIKKCCTGVKEEAYGLRWEYVDIADMDLMINKYLRDIIKVCDDCGMDVDWSEYIDTGVIKRMEETIRFREKAAYNKFDNIRDVLYPERKEPEYYRSEYMRKRAEKWEKLKEIKSVKADDIPEEEKYNPGIDDSRWGEFNPDGMPDNVGFEKGLDDLGEDAVPYDEGLWDRIDESMFSRELDEREKELEKKEKSVEFMKEKLKEQNRRIIESKSSLQFERFDMERKERDMEKELEKKDRQMEKVADIASGKLMGFLDEFLTEDRSDGVMRDGSEMETEDDKLKRLLEEEHNREH